MWSCLRQRKEREQQVLDAMAAGATTIEQMRMQIYPDLDPRLHAAAEIQLQAHLIKLAEEQRI